MGRIGVQELLLVFGLALLIFGPSKLPEIGKSLGKGIREFKQSSKEVKESITMEESEETKNPKSSEQKEQKEKKE